MWLEMSLEIPPELRSDASVLWLDNGRPVAASGLEARIVLWNPGRHNLEAFVSLPGDRHIVYRETVTVLPAATSQPAQQS